MAGYSASLKIILFTSLFCSFITQVYQINSNQFQSARQLYPLRSYKDVQIFKYQIPEEVTQAVWRLNGSIGESYTSTFTSNLKHAYTYYKTLTKPTSIFPRSCQPLDITFHLRWGSIPLLQINNASIPNDFHFDSSHQYEIKLRSDSNIFTFELTNPLPGDWYGLAYLNKVEDHISQKGLYNDCQHKLTSSLSFAKSNPNDQVTVISSVDSLVQNISRTKNYKFYASADIYGAKISIVKCASLPILKSNSCPIVIYSRGMSLASSQNYDLAMNCSQTYNQQNDCVLDDIYLTANQWNYIQIVPFEDEQTNNGNEAIEFVLQLSFERVSFGMCNGQSIDKPRAERIHYFPPDTIQSSFVRRKRYQMAMNNKSSHSLVNQETPSSSFQTAIDHYPNIDFCIDFIKLTRYETPGAFDFKYLHNDATQMNDSQRFSIFFDISNDRITLLQFDVVPHSDIGGSIAIDFAISPFLNTTQNNITVMLCLTNNQLNFFRNCEVEIRLNTSDRDFVEGSSLKSIIIPFPRPGLWFILLKTECYYYEYEENENEFEVVQMACEYNKTSVLIDVTSSSCLQGKCNGKHGKCFQFFNGGILFSSCLCRAGWKGWTCNDGSQAIPDEQLLLNFLLLTLSNILLVPAVILATYRKHFTESLVYFTAMTSSILYHACDSDYSQSYCVLNLSVLQFGDFYTAILGFWVTIISLAHLPKSCQSFFHLLGGIFIAFAVEIDRTSLWAFAVPVGIGVLILILGYICHCCSAKGCYPSGSYWLFCILPGFALTTGGLVIYAFFETQDNYSITHGCWHAIIGLALLFFIPAMKRKTDDDYPGKVTMQNAKLAHVEWRPSHTSFKFLQDDIDML